MSSSTWYVIRAQGVMAEDLTQTADAYEEQFRAAVERASRDHARWGDAEDIRIEDVGLEGSYPETLLVKVFRPATARPTGYDDPEHEARFHDVYFAELLDTEPKAYLRLRGVSHATPTRSTGWSNFATAGAV